MTMKVNKSFFSGGALQKEETIIHDIQNKYKADKNADFFQLEDTEASLRKFLQHLFDQEIFDQDLVDRLTDAIVKDALHPLQCVRLAQIINDPDEELEGEDKEILIAQVLNLKWPQQISI